MGNSNTIELRLTVKDDGTVVVEQFGKNAEGSLQRVDKSSKSATDSLDKFKRGWLEVAAAAGTAGYALYKAMEYIDVGAKAEQAEESYHRITTNMQVDSAALLEAMQRSAARTIDDSKMMQKAVFAISQDIDPNALPQLFDAARIAARKTGIDVEQAADRIIDAVATQMPRGLKQMGSITKEQMELFNRAFAAGITDVNLLDFVIANAAVTTAKMGGVAENAADRVQQLKAALQDLKESASKELLDTLDSLYLRFKKMQDAPMVWPFSMRQLAKGFMGSPYGKKPKETPEETYLDYGEPLGGYAPGDVEVMAESNKKKLEDQVKAKIAAIKNAEDLAKNLKAINDISLKDYQAMSNAKIEMMRLGYANELEIAREKYETQTELDRMYYEGRKKEIIAEADAMAIKDKFFDRETFVAGQMNVLERDRAAKFMANVGEQLKINEMADNQRRAASSSMAAWEQDQMLTVMEYERTKGGTIFAIEKDTWDKIYEYQRVTGEKITGDQIADVDLIVMLYKETLVGGVKYALKEIEDEYTNVGQLMGDFTKRTFGSMTDALADFSVTGSMDFRKFAESVIRDINRIIIQTQLTGPLSGYLQKALGGAGGLSSLFGSGYSELEWAGQAETYGLTLTEFMGAFHRGGMGDEPSFYRQVPSFIFAHAPRYHAGLFPNERPAIITNDEAILTPKMQKALGAQISRQNAPVVNNYIMAMDTESFADFCKRRPGGILAVMGDALKDNTGLRYLIKDIVR